MNEGRGGSCRIRLNSEDEIRRIGDYSSMGCTLYESIVHGDVSFPVNFDEAVEFGVYDSGGGRWYRVLEFELESNGAVLY